jgi:hypothetical protein
MLLFPLFLREKLTVVIFMETSRWWLFQHRCGVCWSNMIDKGQPCITSSDGPVSCFRRYHALSHQSPFLLRQDKMGLCSETGEIPELYRCDVCTEYIEGQVSVETHTNHSKGFRKNNFKAWSSNVPATQKFGRYQRFVRKPADNTSPGKLEFVRAPPRSKI